MKNSSLATAIENMEKKSYRVKSHPAKKSPEQKPINSSKSTMKETHSFDLPAIRKVALAKRSLKFVFLVSLFISCFSISIFIGYFGTFWLFK